MAFINSEKGPDEPELENPVNDHESCDDPGEDISPRRSLLLRVTALVTVLAFIGLIAVTCRQSLDTSIVELVSESMHNKKNIDSRLLQAVVKIDVVFQKKGSSIAVGQKSGTGFNISSNGLIVTNHHVIDNAVSIAVKFPDGKTYGAARWSAKPEYDLALITLNKKNLPAVPLNMSSPPAPGDQVRIVGNPLGLNNIVVEGAVRQFLTLNGHKVFSIDAPVYSGNSGSPVYDRSGKVVGVIFGNLRRNDNGKEVVSGVAVPITDILRIDSTQ